MMIERRLVNVRVYFTKYTKQPGCQDYASEHYRFAEKIKLPIEKAGKVYENLKDCLAIHGERKPPRCYTGQLALFDPENHCWYQVFWAPKLREGWDRLTFQQFLGLYRITTF